MKIKKSKLNEIIQDAHKKEIDKNKVLAHIWAEYTEEYYHEVLAKLEESGYKIIGDDAIALQALNQPIDEETQEIDYDDVQSILEDDNIDLEVGEDGLLKLEEEQSELESLDKITSNMKLEDSLKTYLKEIGQVPLLTAKEEKVLLKVYCENNMYEEKLLGLIENGDKISVEDQAFYDEKKTLALNAKNKLIESNMRLVVSVAKKYHSHTNVSLELMDLIQEGYRGIAKAVEKWDINATNKFSTYAYGWIKQVITRKIANHGRSIRLPAHIFELINKIIKGKNQLLQELRREPTNLEIAKHIEEEEYRVSDALQKAKTTVSLNTPIGNEGEDISLLDYFSSPDDVTPYDAMIEEQKIETLKALFEQNLTDREQIVLSMRYGLFNYNRCTLEDISKQLKLSRERIRQIQDKAMKKLKLPKNKAKLKELR